MTEADQQTLYEETVVPAIKESGTSIILLSKNEGVFDPTLGFIGGGADTPYDGYGLEIESTFESIPSSVAEKVVKTIMAIEIPKPKQLQDNLTMRGETFKVLFVETTQPGNVLFFYTIYLGK